jgi:hypothetical protein
LTKLHAEVGQRIGYARSGIALPALDNLGRPDDAPAAITRYSRATLRFLLSNCGDMRQRDKSSLCGSSEFDVTIRSAIRECPADNRGPIGDIGT